MFKIPNFILLPASYEEKIVFTGNLIKPALVIFLGFLLHYSAFWHLYVGNIMVDVPALVLFCLFFKRHADIHIAIFFLILSIFEYFFLVPMGQSLLFYGLLAGLLYGGLRRRKSLFPHYLIVMSYFLVIYFLALVFYMEITYLFFTDTLNMIFITQLWFYMMIFYPILFHPLYLLLIKNRKRSLL